LRLGRWRSKISRDNETVRIGLLGCGRVAQHYRSILLSGNVTGFTVSACCDLDIDKASDIASNFGADVYQDIDTFLDSSETDVVLVMTPSGSHYENAKRVLESGRHAVVEKPISLIPEHALELTKLASDRGLMYSVIFQNRYNPAIQLLRRTMDQGRFGKIVTSTVRLRWCRYQSYYEDGWHGTWAQDGGVINQQAIHHIDALNWLCGPVTSVSAAMDCRVNQLEAEDTMVAALKFENGALGTIEVTTAARPEDIEASLSVVGEEGMAVIGGIALNLVDTWSFVDPQPEDETLPQTHSQHVPTGYGLSHGPFLQEIIDRLARGQSDAPIPGDEAVKAVNLVHALYASCESGAWTHLVDEPRSQRLGNLKQ